jgi:hypothetical protein
VALLALALICSGLVVAAVLSARGRARRRLSLIRLARAAGLEYAATDVFSDEWQPFKLFSRGTVRGIRNVVFGEVKGIEVRAFDYWYERGDESRTSALRSSWSGGSALSAWLGRTKRFTCAIAGLPSSCPNLIVEPKGLTGRVADAVFPDVPLESEAFDRRFRVRSEDPRFAISFLTPQVMEVLLALPRGSSFSVAEDRLLIWGPQRRPAAVVGLALEAARLGKRIPPVLSSLYPLRPGLTGRDIGLWLLKPSR